MKLYQSATHTAPSGPDLRLHRRHPLLRAGEQVPAVARHEARALLLHDRLADEMGRGLGDEGDAVPVPLRERPRGVEVMARRRGVAAVDVDLPDVGRRVMHRVERRRALVAGTDAAAGERSARQPLQPLEIPVRDGDVEARIVVGGRAEDVERLGEPEAPRVVRRSRHVLEAGAAVRLEAERRLREAEPLPVRPLR